YPYLRKLREANYPPEAEREMVFKLRMDVLNRMIEEKLTSQEAEKLEVIISDAEVDAQIERIKSQHFITDEELRKSLAGEGLTLEEYRERLRAQILQATLVNIEVKSKIAITDKDIREYYEENKGYYEEIKKYHLRTILIKAPFSASSDDKETARAMMESIVRALHSGAPFDELARKYSEDSSAAAGGDLGQFSLDDLSVQVQEALRTMSKGEVSRILETPDGYRILMVQDIEKKPGKSMEEATTEIQEKLYQRVVEEEYEAWLKALRERSYVKISM
ncbi:MAG: peptidylprolyl isomerase, partial [Deltaproteobacteria bacterium]|nr:peptidylprolyl isomerase [Deltaproteobacteria bacterium]